MTTAQLLFVVASAVLGGLFSVWAWRFLQALDGKVRRAPMRLSPDTARRSAPDRADPAPPKPRSAQGSSAAEEILAAVGRVQTAVSDLARVQIELMNAHQSQPGVGATKAIERKLADLPGTLKTQIAEGIAAAGDRQARRTEARLDQIVAARTEPVSTELAERMDKIEAGLNAVFARVNARAPEALSRADLSADLGSLSQAWASKLDSALRATDARIETHVEELVRQFPAPPAADPRLDRIEALLTRLVAVAALPAPTVPGAPAAPEVDGPAHAAALDSYRRTPPPAVQAQPARQSEPALGAILEPGDIKEDSSDVSDLEAHLTRSERRLLKTHPGLASILVKKQKARAGSA